MADMKAQLTHDLKTYPVIRQVHFNITGVMDEMSVAHKITIVT